MTFRPGDPVVIATWSESSFNQRRGVVVGADVPKGRTLVRLENDERPVLFFDTEIKAAADAEGDE